MYLIKLYLSLQQVNKLSTSLLGTPTFTSHQLPSKYTGELVGVEYLYHQSGGTFATKSEDLDKEIDEGFGDIDDQSPDLTPVSTDPEMATVTLPSEESDVEEVTITSYNVHTHTCMHAYTCTCTHTYIHTLLKEENEPEMDTVGEESTDSRGISGWDRVEKLARALVSLSGLSVSTSEAKEIERLYDDLLDYDKRPLVFQPVVHKPPKGRFARTKRSNHPSVDHMKRYFNPHDIMLNDNISIIPLIVDASCPDVCLPPLPQKVELSRLFVCFSLISTLHQQRGPSQEESNQTTPPDGS